MNRFQNWLYSTLFFILALSTGVSAVLGQTLDLGKYHALLIANQNYKYWKPLRTPHEDVKQLSVILEKRYDFNVQVLKDATRDDIIDELERYRQRLTWHDNLLIYYAGHGKLRSDGGYWIGVDAQKKSRSRWLHYRTISELIDTNNQMKARHVLVIADSCYAGALTRDEKSEFAKRKMDETDQAWLFRMGKTPSRTALTSGGTEPVIDRAGLAKTSIFARELLSRLKYNENALDTGSLFGLIKKDVHARARRIVGNDAQAPEYEPIPGTGHVGGDFIFVPMGQVVHIPQTESGDEKGFGIKGDDTVDQSITNSIGMKFVIIPAGSFTMGSQLSPEEIAKRYGGEAKSYKDEQPPHPVKITKPFYLQTTEISQGQWKKVMGDNPSKFKDCGDGCPVENVSWDDAQKFIEKLNQREGKNKYRLPTEAEWEYACRAETTTPFFTGDCISTDHSNYNGNYPGKNCPIGNYREKTVIVGSFQPNAWGLYDMHGNVWEWVQDRYGDYPSNSVVDPKGPTKGKYRVLRGGSWFHYAWPLRSAARSWSNPGYHFFNFGFRVARNF